MAATRLDLADRPDARRLDGVGAHAALGRIARRGEAPWLHAEIARRLADRLVPMRAEPERILDWWAAIGAGREPLRERWPRAEIVAVEAAGSGAPPARARARARARWPWQRRPNASLDDAMSDDAIGRAGLVWANMVLPFVVDPPALFARWHGLLDVDAPVVFSCLGPATLGELREIYRAHGWPAPTPGFIDMHDLGDMLVEAGFSEPVLDQETIVLSWRSAEAALAELRTLGGNAAPDRFAGLRTRAWHERLIDALDATAGADGSIALSIEVAYGHGFKAPPRHRGDAPVAVSLDEMRAMVRRPRVR